MKKSLSLILAVVMLFSLMTFCVSAKEEEEIYISVSNEIVGLSDDDYDNFPIEFSDNIKPADDPIMVCSYTNEIYSGEIKNGRTYYIYYYFVPQSGNTFPYELNDETVNIECGEGCSLVWYGKTVGADTEGLSVYIKVETQGNFFQRLLGRIADIFLKIRMWSPY